MYPHVIHLRYPWSFRLDSSQETDDTIEMPHVIDPADYNLAFHWGTVELIRSFNWVAERDRDEAVFLQLDGLVGKATVFLNDIPLGGYQGVWGTARFEIAEYLRDNNQLLIRTNIPSPEELRFNPYGSLARDGLEGWRFSCAGLLDDAWVSVEPVGFTVETPLVQTEFVDGSGRVQLETSATIHQGKLAEGHPLIASLTLDGTPIAETKCPRTDDGARASISLVAENLPVQPWRSRIEGKPCRHKLVFEVRAGGVTLHRREWKVGFRERAAFESVGWYSMFEFEHLTIAASSLDETSDRIGDIWPDRSYDAYLGEIPNHPFHDWYVVKSQMLRVRNHFGPESFYDLCDRTGLSVLQELPLTGVQRGWESPAAIADRLRRLACRPCLTAFVARD